MRRTTLLAAASLFVAVAVSAQDSPLVAAAKRSNRKASKTPVITNQKLSTNKARLSMAADETTGIANARPSSTAPSQQPKPMQATVTSTTVASNYSATTVKNVEPQSSARSVAGQSTVGNAPVTTGAQTYAPQSTGRTVAPQSTAQSVKPTAAKPAQQQ